MEAMNVLIVDDEEELWAKPMSIQLQRLADLHNIPLRIDIALSAVEARQLLTGQQYHFVSLDINIPEQTDVKVSIDSGVDLKQFLNNHFPKTSFCIFSGRNSQRLDSKQTNVLFKGTGESGCLSAKDWAEFVLNLLRTRTNLLEGLTS